MEPVISVIIPARDASATIERQLRAVCAQELDGSFEVLVVDNGSTDDTSEVVTKVSAALPQIRLVRGPRRPNRSAARNVGAAAAQAPRLAFCDADDIVGEGWLAALTGSIRYRILAI